MKKLLSVLHCSPGSNKNNRSQKGGTPVYYEPDWSSLSLAELLEKAGGFAEKAYSGSLSTLAFLERAIEASPERTGLGTEIAELLDQTQQVNKTLAELQRKIHVLVQEFSHT
jgi:hypothetical protein